jgi:hypothetical protein
MGGVDFWSRHLAACQAQGISINADAERGGGLGGGTLYYWRKHLGLAGSRPRNVVASPFGPIASTFFENSNKAAAAASAFSFAVRFAREFFDPMPIRLGLHGAGASLFGSGQSPRRAYTPGLELLRIHACLAAAGATRSLIHGSCCQHGVKPGGGFSGPLASAPTQGVSAPALNCRCGNTHL